MYGGIVFLRFSPFHEGGLLKSVFGPYNKACAGWAHRAGRRKVERAATMAEDYYSVLGVPKNASQADIQKAYRELARKYHPDMNPDDKTAKKKFQKVQAAFDVLNNPEKREMYDRYGSSFETMGRRRAAAGGAVVELVAGAGGAGPGGYNAEDIDLSQFLGERFGQEGARRLRRSLRPVPPRRRQVPQADWPAHDAAAIWSRISRYRLPRRSPAARCS